MGENRMQLLKAVGVVCAIATFIGGALTLLISSSKIMRYFAKKTIILALKLQGEWNAILEEAKQEYEAETGKPEEIVEQEIQEIGEKAKSVGESAASTISPV